MQNRIRWSPLAMVCLCLTGVSPSPGDQPIDPPSALKLFDGQSLIGWQPNQGSRVGKVEVKDGSMVLRTGEPMTGVTLTRQDLPTLNYRLIYEANRTEGNDFFAAATFPVGPSFVTLVNGGWGGGVTGLSLINGDSAAENETNHFLKYQNNIWYRFEVEVTTRAVRCVVDGAEVVLFPHEGAQLKTRLETRVNQPLGFATYRSTGLIRLVEIKPLTLEEIRAIDAKLKLD